MCKEYLNAYEKTKNPKNFAKAKQIYLKHLIGENNKYSDINTPAMRLKYLELLENPKVFLKDRVRLNSYNRK